jgi:hypothetical protein
MTEVGCGYSKRSGLRALLEKRASMAKALKEGEVEEVNYDDEKEISY